MVQDKIDGSCERQDLGKRPVLLTWKGCAGTTDSNIVAWSRDRKHCLNYRICLRIDICIDGSDPQTIVIHLLKLRESSSGVFYC